MRLLIQRLLVGLKLIPDDLIALLARVGIGTIFLRAGLLKLAGWGNGNTVALFQYEYQLPLIPPEFAAVLAMSMELALPFLIFAGLATRLAALFLLGMTAIIEIFVYPAAFDIHAVWAVALLFLLKNGAGTLSLDHLVGQRILQRLA